MRGVLSSKAEILLPSCIRKIEYGKIALRKEALFSLFRNLFRSVTSSQFLGETHDPVGFPEAVPQMEADAVFVGQFTVAGKFPAPRTGRPVLAALQKLSGCAFSSAFFPDEYTFQISNRAAICALNIVVPKLDLGNPVSMPPSLQMNTAHSLSFSSSTNSFSRSS